jgi:plastocyanin
VTRRPSTHRLSARRRSATHGPRTVLGTFASLAALTLPSAAAADKAVSIGDSGYLPRVVTVKQGEAVTWTNDGKRDHTVTSDTGKTMASDVLEPGDVFATLFTKRGTFRYHSTIGPDRMTGSVIVVAGPKTTSTSTSPTPPTGTLPEGFTPNPGNGSTTVSTTTADQGSTTDWPIVGLLIALALAVAATVIIIAVGRRRHGRGDT